MQQTCAVKRGNHQTSVHCGVFLSRFFIETKQVLWKECKLVQCFYFRF